MLLRLPLALSQAPSIHVKPLPAFSAGGNKALVVPNSARSLLQDGPNTLVSPRAMPPPMSARASASDEPTLAGNTTRAVLKSSSSSSSSAEPLPSARGGRSSPADSYGNSSSSHRSFNSSEGSLGVSGSYDGDWKVGRNVQKRPDRHRRTKPPTSCRYKRGPRRLVPDPLPSDFARASTLPGDVERDQPPGPLDADGRRLLHHQRRS